MKIIKILSFILIVALSMVTIVSASDVFSIKTSLDASTAQQNYGISVMSGEILEFSADDLELRLGLKPQSLDGITVTRLPRPEHGELVLEGVNVDIFEYIPRVELDNLCFVPTGEAEAANITFIPRAEKTSTAELSIQVLSAPNLPPEIQNASYDTASNVALAGHIPAVDPEGDALRIRVTDPPVNGTVTFDGLNFRYTPFQNVSGKDSFAVCAFDSANNFSNKSVVTINIEKVRPKFFYTDMQTHPSAYAAIKLREKKVMTGAQIGGGYFFFPDEMTTRGEFLVMLMSSSGLDKSMKAAVNTGLPNDASIPAWLKQYVKKAIDADIWSATQAFVYDEIPTRAEAVVLTDRAAKITDVKNYTLQMNDVASIPDWAAPSYKNLAAYKMLDLHDNMANPAGAVTNSYSADLIWQLWKHCNK